MDPVQLVALLQSIPYAGYVVPWIPIIIVLANLIDVAVPPPPAGHWSVGLRQVIHYIALNFAYARNAVPAGSVPASTAAKVAEVRAEAASTERAAGELVEQTKGLPEARKPL